MNLIRRVTAAAAAVCLLLSCAGCQKNESSAGGLAETVIPEFSIPENVLGEPSTMIPDVTVDRYKLPESEGLAFVKDMKLGWNLGNTFDASDANVSAENELNYEKAWCGTITTIQNIAAIKAAGFNTIRIPVSWHNHVDEKFHISEKWMARVKEVVDWCRACDLYVIVNTHHDVNEKYYYPDSAHMESSKTYLTAVWQQIAETFKDYDNHLILESLNEPRLVGTGVEWWIDKNNAQCADAINCINTLNQLFVDTVRATGSKNADRWLLIPGYAASADGATNENHKLPTDPANHIIVSVHAYTPYDFALNTKGTKEFSATDGGSTREIDNFMDDLLSKYIIEGIPVLIGEFGALNKDNLEQRVQYAAYYTASARARGITCCWWDNHAFVGSGENFGLLNRRSSTFTYPEIVQALVKYAE